MIGEPSLHMWLTFAIIAVAVAVFASEKASIESTSVGIVVAFLLLFHFVPGMPESAHAGVTVERLLAGFASPALITIIALLVIGQGLVQTGALEAPTRSLQEFASGRSQIVLPLTLIVAAAISAFLNNTPVVVMFIPVVSALSVRLGMSPSKTLMPLSFITILGGMTTLIGSSTNVLVAGLAHDYRGVEIGFFDFLLPGLFLAGIGFVYVLFVAPFLLPKETKAASDTTVASGRQFIAEIAITDDHPLDGETPVAGMFPTLKNMTVRLIRRDDRTILPPFEDISLNAGDVVIVAATRKALTDALILGDSLRPKDAVPDSEASDPGAVDTAVSRRGSMTVAEAVVAPGSRIIGRRVEEVGSASLGGCKILGVQRRSRMVRVPLSELRLESGDVVLVLGSRSQVRSLRLNHDFLLLEWSATELPDIALATRARLIFGLTVLCAATGLVPIVVAALAGAFFMVPAKCLNLRQAARAFDRKIYLLIGASLAMATSLEATGGASFIANSVVHALEGASAAVILSVFFMIIAILTNLLSNHATAALFTPIALDTATTLGVDPMIFVVAVIFAANCSFASPMGYQTNLLVMGSGHYRFSDFLRAGTPLIFILWLAYSVFAPWYYGL